MNEQQLKIAFFGTPDIAVWVLEELETFSIVPSLVVTNPDSKQGRGMELTPTPVKVWAQEHAIPVFQPETLSNKDQLEELTSQSWDLFVVVAYGAIMPKWILELPKHETINVHPSLLPKLRGASPIRTALLQSLEDIGVTIMLMDEKMDHGPILAQMETKLYFPIPGRKLDVALARQGGELLADTIPKWVKGDIQPREQDHTQATFSKKITKEMGELTLDPRALPQGGDAYALYRKICAFDGNPGTFFFYNGKRVKITEAYMQDKNDTLHILKVVPEGKKEMAFEDYVRGL